jgi:hypothetical protein
LFWLLVMLPVKGTNFFSNLKAALVFILIDH